MRKVYGQASGRLWSSGADLRRAGAGASCGWPVGPLRRNRPKSVEERGRTCAAAQCIVRKQTSLHQHAVGSVGPPLEGPCDSSGSAAQRCTEGARECVSRSHN